jgi:hypothetical protein
MFRSERVKNENPLFFPLLPANSTAARSSKRGRRPLGAGAAIRPGGGRVDRVGGALDLFPRRTDE